jgi:hypothetical protein
MIVILLGPIFDVPEAEAIYKNMANRLTRIGIEG